MQLLHAKTALLVALVVAVCDAFVANPLRGPSTTWQQRRAPVVVTMASGGNDLVPRSVVQAFTKTVASTAVAYAALVGVGAFPLEAARAADEFVVLGSGGKTGKLIVDYLKKKGVEVKPMSYRTGTDVTKIDTLAPALTGARAVIFAASASKDGGKADAVDYKGVQNVAAECVRLKVPRLVVISSGAITRPNSLGFKITNLFGRIMEYKLQGEQALKEAYSAADPSLSYVIVRPGGLADGAAAGPGRIELNQGDAISGEVNRADVAEAAAEAALSKTIPARVVFEMYEAGRSAPLEGRFKAPTGYERNGPALGATTTYDVLFEGLKPGEVALP